MVDKRLESNKKVKDITGKVFDKLTVLSFIRVERDKGGSPALWTCKCSCGKQVEITSLYLRGDYFRSCGCYDRMGNNKIGKRLLWGFGVNDLLEPTQREEIYSRWKARESQYQLAKEFGVHQTTISNLVRKINKAGPTKINYTTQENEKPRT